SSPARRARETAELVRLTCAPNVEVELLEELSPTIEAPPFELARSLGELDANAMIIGHQPWVEGLARGLVAENGMRQGTSEPRSPAHSKPEFKNFQFRGVRTATIIGVMPMDGAWRITTILDPP